MTHPTDLSEASLRVEKNTPDQQNSQTLYPSPLPVANPSKAAEASKDVHIIVVHYKVGRKIGEGSFGVLHEGVFFFVW